MIRWTVILGAIAALSSGCEENCQSTCGRIYNQSECGISVSGVPVKTLRDSCVTECETALKNAGEMGSYNPRNRANPIDPPELENERQAAAWMDCVWSVECVDLEPSGGGMCPPI